MMAMKKMLLTVLLLLMLFMCSCRFQLVETDDMLIQAPTATPAVETED